MALRILFHFEFRFKELMPFLLSNYKYVKIVSVFLMNFGKNNYMQTKEKIEMTKYTNVI